MFSKYIYTSLLLAIIALQCEAQLLDRLMNMNTRSGAEYQGDSNGTQQQGTMATEMGPVLRRFMSSLQTVSVPAFYEMTKDGSSLGINVLQGLVKVERGREAERNGLVGPRPLSVRVFGVPVYERGQRMRPPTSGSEPLLPDAPAPGKEADNGKPEIGPEEELPIEP